MTIKKLMIGLALSGSLATGMTHAATAEDVENSFYPYKSGVPSFNGLSTGMTINSGNVGQFESIIDPELFKQIQNGWMDMQVGATTSFDLHPNYVQATRDNLNKVSLGAEVGQINNFVAGRPFPEEPDMNDPRAGEKLAWNYKYGYNWGDNAAIYPFYWKYRNMDSGNVERTIKFNFHFLNFNLQAIFDFLNVGDFFVGHFRFSFENNSQGMVVSLWRRLQWVTTAASPTETGTTNSFPAQNNDALMVTIRKAKTRVAGNYHSGVKRRRGAARHGCRGRCSVRPGRRGRPRW